jgi:toxin YoeB
LFLGSIPGLREKAQVPTSMLAEDPARNPPPSEKFIGDLAEACSRRINIQHRLAYQVFEQERIVRVLRLWTHCE